MVSVFVFQFIKKNQMLNQDNSEISAK